MASHVQCSSLRTTDPDSSGLIVMAYPPQEYSLRSVVEEVLSRVGDVIEWFATRIAQPPVSIGIVMGAAGGGVIAVGLGADRLAAAALVLGCGAAGGAGGYAGNRPGFLRG